MAYKRWVITRTKPADHAVRSTFFLGGRVGVPFTQAIWRHEDCVDHPSEPIGLPKKEKIRFHFMCENTKSVQGQQIRIAHGKKEKTKSVMLRDVAKMLGKAVNIDVKETAVIPPDTFIERLGMHRDDIYIMNFDQISVGTIQVLLASSTSQMRLYHTQPILDQPTDHTDGYSAPVNNSLITYRKASSTVAFPVHAGSYAFHHSPTVGAQAPWLSAAFPDIPISSSSRLQTDNAGTYTGNLSHYLPQPGDSGRGDGQPNLFADNLSGGGSQEQLRLLRYEKPAFYRYTDSEYDLPDWNSWPGYDQDN